MLTDRPVPESLPRQKAHTYIFLIGLTGVLIYFYSYPLNTENWTYVKQKLSYDADSKNERYPLGISDANRYASAAVDDKKKFADSIILKKLFLNISGDILTEGKQSKSTETTKKGGRSPTETEHKMTVIVGQALKTDVLSTPTIRGDVKKSEIVKARKNYPVSTEITKERFLATTFAKIQSEETKHGNATAPPAKELDAILTSEPESVTKVATIYTPDYITASTANEDVGASNKSRQAEVTRTSTQTSTNITIINIHTNRDENTSQDVSIDPMVTRHTKLKEGSITESVIDPTSSKENASIAIEKRYLVFSEHCRIPDLDPMDPSIAHLISKTPPLDCSENHRPLTRTEAHVLYLNQTAAMERTVGRNYSCCYRSVFRELEGQSDDSVGFGKKCIQIFEEATIREEFIAVECKLRNGTIFYREFHSFIFDKPKVEKRCGNGTDSQYSVLIVGVDAVSRLNMHRQLNATAEYLQKKMDAIEMYGFNKVGDNTFPNLIPLLMGYDERELPEVCWKSKGLPLDRCNFLWKRFAKGGYRTLYAEDSPHISTFNYVKSGFYLQPTDYYFRPFILAYEDALRRAKPLNCYLCVGSTSETEAVLHWTEQFASHFATRPSFAFSWINSVTHDFLNTGSSADHMYERFFRTLHQTGALDKTIVILMGDHGMRWGEIRHTYIGRMEERLPMLMISLPQQFKRNHPEFAEVLRQNSRRLVTPFDLHATLAHLLDLKENWSITNPDNVAHGLSSNFTKRAMSLFQPIPKGRSCDDAFIEEHWCTCESSLEVDIQEHEVQRVAKFLLNRINKLLKPASDKCALLKLDSITDARLWQPPAEHQGHSADDSIYTAVIQTSPGKAVFEGTVKITQSKNGGELLGTISRLNLYGNQSLCINDTMLKKYCYCL